MESKDRLLTVQELAAYLAVPVATVYQWRWRGEGPPGFPGRAARPLPLERRPGVGRPPTSRLRRLKICRRRPVRSEASGRDHGRHN
jgi:excisionase family DNA binding protein